MVRVRSAASHGVRAIICLRFAGEGNGEKVQQLKRRLLDRPAVLHAVDCSGSFDFMIEASCDDLTHYQELIDFLRADCSGLVDDFEHSLVCRRYLREREGEECLWLPTHDGQRRVAVSAIKSVVAEGDYVRLYTAECNWLMHSTLCALERMLVPHGFVKVHRSLLVRRAEIEQITHGTNGWLLRLRDGTTHRIPKARTQAVRAQLGVESSIH